MSGDIFTCLGHTDWHYFEPCTSVGKRWERAFGIRSNCICSITDYIKNVVRCVKINEKSLAVETVRTNAFWSYFRALRCVLNKMCEQMVIH